MPADIESALRADGAAWVHFAKLAPSYRRLYVRWIEAAKRPETRARRLAEAVTLLAQNKKLGLK
ncbi:MAG TPA: YdeI/OmpD-associated family protein [Thermoanaerobaculia bacterium]|nr:YdeI/OmpD-associated family protein [Thermoanaerobaculia bacterium]